MSQNVARFPTPQAERAAVLISEGWTDERVAIEVSRSRKWVGRLKQNPEFLALVEKHVASAVEALKAKGIAERQARIDDGVDLHNRMRRVIEERAESDEWGDVPGWKSGLLVHNIKAVGMLKVDVFEVDTALVAAINANKKQVAQEVGQWSEKRELTGKDGGAISFIGLMESLE